MEKDEFKRFIEEKRTWYKKVDKVFCPILNEWVIFNSQGFYHLRYDGTGKMRTQKEQVRRFEVLELTIEVIQRAKNIVDFQERPSGEYWRIERRINDKYIAVILRRNHPGPIIFYSTWQD